MSNVQGVDQNTKRVVLNGYFKTDTSLIDNNQEFYIDDFDFGESIFIPEGYCGMVHIEQFMCKLPNGWNACTALNIHINIGRGMMTNQSNTTKLYTSSDVLAVIPLLYRGSNSNIQHMFDNQTAMPFHTDVVESLHIYFTNERGERVNLGQNYVIVLTFNTLHIAKELQMPKPKRARMQLLDAIGGPSKGI